LLGKRDLGLGTRDSEQARGNQKVSTSPKSRVPGPDIARLERENARLIQDVAAMHSRFRRLARAVWRVEEDERRHLARELHDNLGQVLTALRLKLERLPAGEDRDAAVEIAAQALEDVRNLSRLLRPPVLDDLGLGAALNWLARRMSEDAGLPVRVTGSLDRRLDAETETLIFRIAQEALTNIVKHAGATRAEISFGRTGDRLELRVRDNGRGFDPKTLDVEGAGVGLAGMRDRAALFGGALTISSAAGKGTVVGVTMALSPASEAAP
jgi:two-component system sensor histidine kinase UhpB